MKIFLLWPVIFTCLGTDQDKFTPFCPKIMKFWKTLPLAASQGHFVLKNVDNDDDNLTTGQPTGPFISRRLVRSNTYENYTHIG